jgi:hypothetical protein
MRERASVCLVPQQRETMDQRSIINWPTMSDCDCGAKNLATYVCVRVVGDSGPHSVDYVVIPV